MIFIDILPILTGNNLVEKESFINNEIGKNLLKNVKKRSASIQNNEKKTIK